MHGGFQAAGVLVRPEPRLHRTAFERVYVAGALARFLKLPPLTVLSDSSS